MKSGKKLIIYQQNIPCRLDRYLRLQFPTILQSVIEKACRSGDIKVNNHKVKTSYRLTEGDSVALSDFFRQNIAAKYAHPTKSNNFKPGAKELAAKCLDEYLLLDHKHFFAINKPTGLAVQ